MRVNGFEFKCIEVRQVPSLASVYCTTVVGTMSQEDFKRLPKRLTYLLSDTGDRELDNQLVYLSCHKLDGDSRKYCEFVCSNPTRRIDWNESNSKNAWDV